MSNYSDAFEQYSNRGDAIGATALLERVEQDLSGLAHLETPHPRWARGPAVAVAAFVAVLLVGGIWALTVRSGSEPGPVVDAFGVEWVKAPDGLAFLDRLISGPTGFVRQTFEEGRSLLEFTADGEVWTEVELEGDDPPALGTQIMASNDAWMILSVDQTSSRAWWSIDGRTWTAVVWPEAIADTVGDIIASGTGFLAISRDRFGEGTTYWWSESGESWAEVDAPVVNEERSDWMRGSSAGLVTIAGAPTSETSQTFAVSSDGVSWWTSEISLPTDLAEEQVRWWINWVDQLDGIWVAIGEIELVGQEPSLIVWTSSDGNDWISQGGPSFEHPPNTAVMILQTDVSGGLLVITPATIPLVTDGSGFQRRQGSVVSTGELWATKDGREWVKVLDTSEDIVSIAFNSTMDRPTGFWIAQPPPTTRQEEPTETTVALPVAPQELDQAGLELQDEIIADGVVTEEEYRRALDGWQECMESRGDERATYELDARGGVSFSYSSPEASTSDACMVSYIEQVSAVLQR